MFNHRTSLGSVTSPQFHRTRHGFTAHFHKRGSHGSTCPPWAPTSFTFCCTGTDHVPLWAALTQRQHKTEQPIPAPCSTGTPWHFSFVWGSKEAWQRATLEKGGTRSWEKPMEVRQKGNRSLQQACSNLCWMWSWNPSTTPTQKASPGLD